MPRRKPVSIGPVPATNEIVLFLHCRQCMSEMPPGFSPRDWARIEVGWTKLGIQVWCIRHEINIMHMDFEGQKHPATLNRADRVQ
jgi:hypothetical protein